MNLEPQSVSTLTNEIKEILESQFLFVFVKGEVSNYKIHSSGHTYFTLKDATAAVNCIIWKNTLRAPKINDGDVVTIQGRLSLYPSSGGYRIVCSNIEKFGVGDFYREFLLRKQRLFEQGYFDEEIKKPIPFYPKVIGIITSETGAVLQDIIVTLQSRYPLVTVILRPSLVQGTTAVAEIVSAILDLQKYSKTPDLIILARGGGSIEDLWCFNAESVANAIYNCPIPIISAIGHETDTTIADLVADKRANTPTAAAELATPITLASISDNLYFLEERMFDTVEEKVESIRSIIENSVSSSLLSLLRSNCTQVQLELNSKENSILNFVKNKEQKILHKIVNIESTLKVSDPNLPFHRGFAIIRRNNKIVEINEKLLIDDEIEIERLHFTDKGNITNGKKQ